MPKKPLTILAINPGARYMGIALYHGAQLRDWEVNVIKGQWSRVKHAKVKRMVWRLMEEHQADVLVIKKLHPSRSSADLNRLVSQIKELANKKRLKVREYSIHDLESFFSPEKRINKRKLAEILTSCYPVLYQNLVKEKTNKNPYFIRMFEAVALGAVCFHSLDKH